MTTEQDKQKALDWFNRVFPHNFIGSIPEHDTIRAALTTQSMEDGLAEALGEIRELSVIEWEEYAQAVDTIADKALAKYRERKK